jgi:FMN phosphatase YigB (HAD superfamily)
LVFGPNVLVIVLSDFTKIVSFDLYDTLIMRRSLSSRSIYYEVWSNLRAKGLILPDSDTFVEHRLKADAASRHIDAPSLGKILEFLDYDLKSLSREIEAEELSVELKQLRMIPGASQLLHRARSSGYRIAFVSDMHIGGKFLEPRLRELGVMVDGDILLVSSDVGLSKSRDGRLFNRLLKSESLGANCLTHYGNSVWSDVKMANRAGISGVLCPAANPNRYESFLLDRSHKGDHLDRLASVSRDVRLECGDTGGLTSDQLDAAKESLYGISSSVAAPVLFSFVCWVIDRCRRESISSIRFLTRDGELLCAIANAMPAKMTEGLEFGVLEVSRRSLLLPAASVVPLESWIQAGLEPRAFLLQQYQKLSPSQIIARAGLSFDLHAEILHPFGLMDTTEPMGEAGLTCWRRALRSDKVKAVIAQESQRRLTATQAYLQQNLSNRSGSRTALVDIGWTGQQAAMLSALIRHGGGQDPLHLLIGRMDRDALVVPANIEGWLFDEPNKLSPIENPIALLESFCATTSGGVEGYELNASSGHATAIRRSHEHQSMLEQWGQPDVQRCVLHYAALAGEFANELDPIMLRNVAEELLREFWEHPTRIEAQQWGAFPYEQDQAGEVVRQLVSPYNFAQLKARFKKSYNGLDWKAGSVELSPTPIRQLLKLRERLRRS